MFAPLDAFTIEDGEVVDYDPAEHGIKYGAYQSLTANGYDFQI